MSLLVGNLDTDIHKESVKEAETARGAVSLRILRPAGHHWQLEEKNGRDSPSTLQEEPTSPTPCWGISSLQNCVRG